MRELGLFSMGVRIDAVVGAELARSRASASELAELALLAFIAG